MRTGINIVKNNYTAPEQVKVGQDDAIAFKNLELICKYYVNNNLTDKFFIRFYQALHYMQTNVGEYCSWLKYTKNETGTQYPDLMQFLGIYGDNSLPLIIDNQEVTKCDLRHIAGKSFGHIGNGKQNNPFALTTFGQKVLPYIESIIPSNKLQIDITGKGAKAVLFPSINKKGRKPKNIL